MRSTPIPISPCPWCGATTEVASARRDVEPKPGDYSICWQCCRPCRFDDALRHVAVPADDVPPWVAAEVARLRRFKGRGVR